jgi:hypothetical protein
VGGAQVDAHGDAALVGVGRLAGFGDLQQCHGRFGSSDGVFVAFEAGIDVWQASDP